MSTFTLHLYREGNRWFFDDVKKNIEHEEFVGGIPEILYALTGMPGMKGCDVTLSTSEPLGAALLTLSDEEDRLGGVYYIYDNEGKEMKGWLCPVFWEYFQPPFAPKKLWVIAVPRSA